ncbi:MAG: VanZ family protein [Pseudomonadota bacterium]
MSIISWKLFWRINAIVIAILVTILSLIPHPGEIEAPINWSAWLASLLLGDPMSGDKVSHFLAYGALGFFSALGFTKSWQQLILLFGGLLLYGAFIEVLQAYGGVRNGDAQDLVANGLGAFCGIAGAVLLRHLFRRYALHLKTPIVR